MNWIKANYDRFLLGVAALILLASGGLILNNARAFDEAFNDLRGDVVKSKAIPGVPMERLADQASKIKQPATWNPTVVEGRRQPLFVSIPYIAKPAVDPNTGATNETLIDPETSTEKIHEPIPNKWFIDHNLRDSLLAVDALTQDPDGDGFSNLEEFNANTDPAGKESHPPYTSKLYLERFIQIPFRLRFEARNGEVVQINPLDVPDAPSQFLRKGQPVQGTKFKIIDVEIKSEKIEGINRDTSVVTLQNTETGDKIRLPKEQDVNSPTSYAVLIYVWGEGRRYQLKKDAEFSLKPEENIKYRLGEVSQTDATIVRLSDNQTLKVPPLPARSTPTAPSRR